MSPSSDGGKKHSFIFLSAPVLICPERHCCICFSCFWIFHCGPSFMQHVMDVQCCVLLRAVKPVQSFGPVSYFYSTVQRIPPFKCHYKVTPLRFIYCTCHIILLPCWLQPCVTQPTLSDSSCCDVTFPKAELEVPANQQTRSRAYTFTTSTLEDIFNAMINKS